MLIYQLSASGPLKYLDGRHKIASRKVFATREAAEAYKPEFAVVCTSDLQDNPSLLTLGSVQSMAVLELELIE